MNGDPLENLYRLVVDCEFDPATDVRRLRFALHEVLRREDANSREERRS
jgi:hypothetical protein